MPEMPERCRYFIPFDVTYGEVARRTRLYLAELAQPWEQWWLANLVWRFQTESDAWDRKPNLAPYRSKMSRLKLKVLQLSGGAYLHIAYDLPRKLAELWSVGDMDEDMRKADLYDDIGEIFPEVIRELSGRSDVVGSISLGLRTTPMALSAIENWVGNLRKAAWSHARQLQAMPSSEREAREDAILEAVTAALEDTSNWKPWSALALSPPHLPLPSYQHATAFAGFFVLTGLSAAPAYVVVQTFAEFILTLMLISTLLYLIIVQEKYRREQKRFRERQRYLDERNRFLGEKGKKEHDMEFDGGIDKEAFAFVDDFGQRVAKYVGAMMENPEGFRSFRENYNRRGRD